MPCRTWAGISAAKPPDMGYLGSQWRSVKRQMTPGKVVMRLLFGHPRNHPTWSNLNRSTTVARIRVDPATGKTTSRGVRRGKDGWQPTAKRKAASSRSKPKQRRAGRAEARTVRRTPGRRDNASSPLARDYQQGAGGRMNGSAPTPARLPTPRQATGLTRLGCDWCRSSGMRPVYTGEGRIKIVIAVLPCNHRWSSKANGPAQKPPERTDALVCPPCQNTGLSKDKLETCPTCQGWIGQW